MADGRTEIQLGHMCNNRCVFCVSGQRTEMREALPLAADPILKSIRELRESGGRQLTFLGGEPTIQPAFLESVKYAVSLGFEEIVVHTNGVKTSRASFVDEVLSFGDNINFRLSFQGATKEAHERTTKKTGSFGRLVESMKNIQARGRKISVNMCVVQSNYESIEAFPELLLPYGVWQLHLDMMRPLDSGARSEEELRGMIPRYPLMREPLERMVAGFPEGFDVNIGNLPFCIAPKIAHVIRHDGQTTLTVAVDGDDGLSNPWDKYENKKRDKVKADGCQDCVFDAQCSGFYETYREFHGTGDFVPVTAEKLLEVDPELRLFTVHLRQTLEHLQGWQPPEPFEKPTLSLNTIDHVATLSFGGPAGPITVRFTRPNGGVGGTTSFSMHVVEVPDTGPFVRRLLRDLFSEAAAHAGAKVVHPVGDDAVFLGERAPRLGGLMDHNLNRWMRVLRSQAPFGDLNWREASLASAGRVAALVLADARGSEVRVTLASKGAQMGGRYELMDSDTPPSDELKQGLAMLFGLLRGERAPSTP